MRHSTGAQMPQIEVHRIPSPSSATPVPDRSVVGSKAHYLMRMARRGLSVPAAFVLATDLCRAYMAHGREALQGLEALIAAEIEALGEATGRRWGDGKRPLLVSVRSGAPLSMPGMMETVLNVGLNRESQRGLLRMTGNPRLVQDCRRRLFAQFGEVVHGIPAGKLAAREAEILQQHAAADCDGLDSEGLGLLAEAFEELIVAETGAALPEDPTRQLMAAIEAVLRSWSSERARSYRKLNGVPDTLGTAVLVQTMVFGNLGPTSGSGVGFTRNPSDGSNAIYGDFLANAQGEDVVAGRRRAEDLATLQWRAPQAYAALMAARGELEAEFKDMQDFEFTVEEGRLLLLQSRPGKRTPLAAVRIAHDLVAEGKLAPAGGLALLGDLDLDGVRDTRLELPADAVALATGVSAGAGVAVGAAAFDPARVADLAAAGGPVILFCETAETGDIAALAEAAALVTAQGARTAHAAVVVRQLGKPCIVGCRSLQIEASRRSGVFGAVRLGEGDPVSIDGATGRIYAGAHAVACSRPERLIAQIRHWQAAAEAPAHKAGGAGRGAPRKGR
ncbi:MAG: PEP/pyruvate-binding domain-containing protein [Hyphomicrobiaceae bacterium]|nr:PEP/pyruvate-binding domain-containing protein [Hyphomicrobiaceae bacterium]